MGLSDELHSADTFIDVDSKEFTMYIIEVPATLTYVAMSFTTLLYS